MNCKIFYLWNIYFLQIYAGNVVTVEYPLDDAEDGVHFCEIFVDLSLTGPDYNVDFNCAP